MRENNRKLTSRFDLFLLVGITAVFVLLVSLSNKTSITSVEVLRDNQTIMRIDQPGAYPIVDGDKLIMEVVFDSDGVFIRRASCPDKICEKMGRVRAGGIIVCVPNKVIVKVNGKTDRVDTMTW